MDSPAASSTTAREGREDDGDEDMGDDEDEDGDEIEERDVDGEAGGGQVRIAGADDERNRDAEGDHRMEE
jgi:hypothetical protein